VGRFALVFGVVGFEHHLCKGLRAWRAAAEADQEPAQALQLVQVQPLGRHGLPSARHVQQKGRHLDPADQQIEDPPHLVAQRGHDHAVDRAARRDLIGEGPRVGA